MNTYCDDCKRYTGGNMRKSDVPGGDDHNRCWECEATIQAGMVEADSMIAALRASVEKLEWLREVEQFKLTYAWPKWWSVQCTKAICELNEIHSAALAECEEVKRG